MTMVTRSSFLVGTAIVGMAPLAFLAYSVVYMLGYTATLSGGIVVVLGTATIALAAALAVFALWQVSGPLVVLDWWQASLLRGSAAVPDH
jgi:hypothetical protein